MKTRMATQPGVSSRWYHLRCHRKCDRRIIDAVTDRMIQIPHIPVVAKCNEHYLGIVPDGALPFDGRAGRQPALESRYEGRYKESNG